ncbi:MAG: glycosyltransferase family 2 protein [Patescibacteria group bacterium]|nr:glycosyltransferase family 2 protein [Patescibacteria group bacterium]
MKSPFVSVVIPTLNAASVLEECLEAISKQDYPEDKVEIVVADGGSTDGTVALAEKYGARVVENKLKTGEAGKAVGVKAAQGDLVALIDSDNILPSKNWFRRMVEPFEDPEIVGSEPWKYTWRTEDGFIDRYCALMGMNDPFCYFTGNYDRLNVLSGKWTGLDLEEEDKGRWLKVTLSKKGIPTIGANGTMLRRSFLEEVGVGDYLFDIDLLASAVEDRGELKFAKVKVGIIHLYCGSNISKFVRKQRRRVRDFLYHEKVGDRDYPWQEYNRGGIIKFVASCVTILPLIYQTVKGFLKKPDFAWLFHPLACWATLWVYGWGRVRGFFSVSELSREGWGQ